MKQMYIYGVIISEEIRILVDNTQLFADFNKGRHCPVDVLGGVGGTDLDPDPGLAPGHHREAEAYHEYSLIQHQTGELCVELLVHQHDGADGMVLSSDGEASRGHGPPEPHRVLTDLFHQGVVGHQLASRNNRMTRWKVIKFTDHVEHLAGRAHDRRGEGVGEGVWPGPLPQQRYQLTTASRVAASRAP